MNIDHRQEYKRYLLSSFKGGEILSEELPQQLQHQLMRLQQIDQQVRVLTTQRTQLELQLRETENALKELESVEEGVIVYKSVGMLLIKTDRNKLTEELNDKKETLDMRIKTLQRQEERSKKQRDEMREKLARQIQGGPETPA